MKTRLFSIISRPEIIDLGDRALVNGHYFGYGGQPLGPAKFISGNTGASRYRLADPGLVNSFFNRCHTRSAWGGTLAGSGDWTTVVYKPSAASPSANPIFTSTMGSTKGQKFTIRFGNSLWRIEEDYSLTYICTLSTGMSGQVGFVDETASSFYFVGGTVSSDNTAAIVVTKGTWVTSSALSSLAGFGTKCNPQRMIDSDITNAKYPLFIGGPASGYRTLTPVADDFGARCAMFNSVMTSIGTTTPVYDASSRQFIHSVPVIVNYGGKNNGYVFYQKLNADGTTVDTGVLRVARGDAAITKQTLTNMDLLPGSAFPTTADFTTGDAYNTACDSFTYTSGADTFIGFFVHQFAPKGTELLDNAKYGINSNLTNFGARRATTLASFIVVFKVTGTDSLDLVSYTALDTADAITMAVFNPKTKQLMGAAPAKGVILYENTNNVYAKSTTHSELQPLEIFSAAGAFYVYDADSVLWQITTSPTPPQIALNTDGNTLTVSAQQNGSAVNINVQVTLSGMTFQDGSVVQTVTTPASLSVVRKTKNASALAKVV